mgnify:CR=1 FL=1
MNKTEAAAAGNERLVLQVEDNTPILEGGLYPVLEAKGTAGLMEALKEVGEMKDEDASAATMDFERLWNEYRNEQRNDTTQYGGSSGSNGPKNNYADEYTKEMAVERVHNVIDEVCVEKDPYDESDF